MRKEATAQEWKRLYDLGMLFMKKKPWEILNNEEYIRICFSEDDEAFFTIMGNGGMEYGFGMYIGEIAFRELNLLINSQSGPEAEEYSLYLQNCLVMFTDRKQDVPDEQMAVIKELKLNFGKGRDWLYFEKHARGFLPYIPDQEEVRVLIRYMEQLLPCLDQIEKKKPRGFHLIHHGFDYTLRDGSWKLESVIWNTQEMGKLPLTEKTGNVRQLSSSWKQLNATWEVDLALIHARIDDENYDRPLYPYMLLIVDHKIGSVIFQEILNPLCDPPELCKKMIELMHQNGKPKEILVSGPIMKEIFSVLERDTDVPVTEASLTNLEEFKKGLLQHMSASCFNDAGAGSFLEHMGLKEEEIQSLLDIAGVDSEQDLLTQLSERFQSLSSPDGGMFFGSPLDYDGWDDSRIIWDNPSTLRKKTECTRQFFEHSLPFVEEEAVDDDWDDWDEEKCSGMIDASWCEDWAAMISLCKREKLLAIAEKLGVKSDTQKKAAFAAEIHKTLAAKPGRLKDFLTDTERAALKLLRAMANKEDCVFSDAFPFPAGVIVSLLENGVIDINTGHTGDILYLTVRLPRNLKGIHL